MTAGLLDGVQTPGDLERHEATIKARTDELVRYGCIKLRPSEYLARLGRQLIKAMGI